MRRKWLYALLPVVALICIAWVSGYHDNVIPVTDATYDIGSRTSRWNNISCVNQAVSTVNLGTCTDAGDLTFTVTLDPTVEIITGTVVGFIASTPNATGPADLIIGSTTYSLRSLHNASPAANYIESGSFVLVGFDGTYMQILTPDANP